jgi:DNA-binding LacI/PurR family transcriptional regulator
LSTIKDVAKQTGLSLATISKYLNGGTVRGENRRLIEEAVAALGYRVNRNARSLKTNRTMTVGVVMPTLSVPFFGSVLSALDGALREAGYTSCVQAMS